MQFEFVSDEARSEDVILDDLCHSEDTSATGQSPKGGPVERRKSERQDQAAEDPQIGNERKFPQIPLHTFSINAPPLWLWNFSS